MNSEFLNEKNIKKAKETIVEEIEKLKIGRKCVKFKLKDWVYRDKDTGDALFLLFTEKMEKS